MYFNMKKLEFSFAILSVPMDYLMLIVAGLTAYTIRLHPWITELRPVIFRINFSTYVSLLLVMSSLWVLFFAFAGLYAIPQPRKFFDSMVKIFLGSTSGLLAIIVWMFIQRNLFDSRFIILAAWTLAILFVSLGRLILRVIRRWALLHKWGMESTLVIGNDDNTKSFCQILETQPEWGFTVAGVVTQEDILPKLDNFLRHHNVENIIIADVAIPKNMIDDILDASRKWQKNFYYVADIFDTHLRNIDIMTISSMPLIHIKRTPLDGWGKVAKRILDIIVSIIAIILLSPVCLIATIATMLDSGNSVIVGLQRVGALGHQFTLYKFRSMVINADQLKEKLLGQNERADGPLFKMQHDPRVTRIGKNMRKWSIDEIPQFWNVLKGEMSVVGPRPHEPGEVAQYSQESKAVLTLKPGITGLAQVSGRSGLTF